MMIRFLLILLLTFSFLGCSKQEDLEYKKSEKIDPFKVYQEGLEEFDKRNYFFFARKI